MTMAIGGGLVHEPPPEGIGHGYDRLVCPVTRCPWYAEVTNLGEFVDLGITEDGVRAHLSAHTPDEWMATLGVLHREIRRLGSVLGEETSNHRAALAEMVPRCCAVEAVQMAPGHTSEADEIVELAEERHDAHH